MISDRIAIEKPRMARIAGRGRELSPFLLLAQQRLRAVGRTTHPAKRTIVARAGRLPELAKFPLH
jgi:hypothetical protein